MFAYCLNNPVMYADNGGTWPSLSQVFAAVAVVAATVAVVAACVATAGAAAPALLAVGGTVVNTAAVVGAATVVATEAAAVAGAALTTAVVAKKVEQRQRSYTVYCLKDANDQVVYVGRTCDYIKRMQAHKLNPNRADLTPEVLHENLTYGQARAAEQAYIVYYGTLDKTNKAKNQINGVNPNRTDYKKIMKQGFGINEALDSIFTNYFLDLFE